MRCFREAAEVGTGQIQSLAFTAAGRQLLVDEREWQPTDLGVRGLVHLPACNLVWWDWQTGRPVRTLHLRDTLYDPTKTPEQWEGQGLGDSDWDPDQPARDVFVDRNGRIGAAIWEWTGKEDGISLFDLENNRQLDILVECSQVPVPRRARRSRASRGGGGNGRPRRQP